jgi:hypothetical protein
MISDLISPLAAAARGIRPACPARPPAQDHVNPEHAAHFAALEGKSPDAAALDDKARGLPTHDTKTTDSKP